MHAQLCELNELSYLKVMNDHSRCLHSVQVQSVSPTFLHWPHKGDTLTPPLSPGSSVNYN